MAARPEPRYLTLADGICARCGRTEAEILRQGAVLTDAGDHWTVLAERDGQKVCQMNAIVWCDIVASARRGAEPVR